MSPDEVVSEAGYKVVMDRTQYFSDIVGPDGKAAVSAIPRDMMNFAKELCKAINSAVLHEREAQRKRDAKIARRFLYGTGKAGWEYRNVIIEDIARAIEEAKQ